MQITTIGVDLAKNVFQVHGIDKSDKVVKRKQLRRNQMKEFFCKLPPCVVGMEACGSSHYWARTLQEYGHTVKLMAPQYVKPYVKTNKNDQRDAEAICEAVSRPTMRFVPIKTAEQQAILCLHRGRAGFVKARTAQSNQMRGLLSEFGLVFPKGVNNLLKGLPAILEENMYELPSTFIRLMNRLLEHLKGLDKEVKELELEIQVYHRENEACKKIAKLEGIGPITATALVATIGNCKEFRSGREVSAWLGLVPRQYSTGGKNSLGGISKRGDTYLRTLLIHGARSALIHAGKEGNDTWKDKLVRRRNKNVAAVALANKNARIVWALLAHDREYIPDYEARKAMAEA